MIGGGDQVYDWPAVARSVILAYIWGTNHVLPGGNSRYYLNPYTLKLETITSDQAWPKSIEYGLTYPYPLPYRRFVESETFRNLYTDALRSVVEKEAELFPFFSSYFKLFPNDIHTPLRMVSDNMGCGARTGYQDILKLHRDILPTDRFVYLGNPAAAKKLTREVREQLQVHVHIRHFTDGIVRIRNLLDIPVALEEVRASDGILWERLPEIPVKGEIDLDTGFDGIRDNEITGVTRIDEFRRSHEASLSLIPLRELNNPLLGYSDPTDTHEFIQGDRNGYRFDRGSWRINLPLIRNGDTEIPAGTTLDFAPNAYLVVHGALNARGEPAAPIRMQGAVGRWKGIYVYDSPQISEWSHVEIADAAELQDGPLILSGAVNLYRSDLIADNVTIRNSSGEDALNIVQSKVDLDNFTVVDARSDAVDLDFRSGVLRNYSVIGANGDGLDISGGSLNVENMSATNINDKALSAGEASSVTLRGAKMTSVGVGIASKDGSSVYAENVNISNVTLHPAMSYRKKDFYGPPELKLVRLEDTEGAPLLRQSGSGMSLDGKEIEKSALDVKALYLNGVMAK